MTNGSNLSHSLSMGKLRRLAQRICWLRRRDEWEQDTSDEMEFHIAMRESRNRESGMAPDAAREEALRAFGNATLLRERARDEWGWQYVEELLHDSRVAARGLRRNPGYAMLAAGTLALAIGACTAVFTLAWSLLLAPLPYADDGKLVLGQRAIRRHHALVWQQVDVMRASIDRTDRRRHAGGDTTARMQRVVERIET